MTNFVAGLFAGAVTSMDPERSTLGAMQDGLVTQQRSRQLKASTIGGRPAAVRRFAEYSNQYPWQWTPPEFEAFVTSLAGARPTTIRGYQAALRLFLEYVSSPDYEWVNRCRDEFGSGPTQIVTEWNSYHHTTLYEGDPGCRPLTYDEVQALFDAADGLVESIRTRGRKGAVAAQRDAIVRKVVYAFGLRRRELWGLDLADLHGNPKVPDYGNAGCLFVRWGKSSRGGPPKRRSVLLVPEMDWVIAPLRQRIDELRPLFGPVGHPALFLSERAGRLSLRPINRAFNDARAEAGLPGELDLHSLATPT
ncbi:MAG: site-specific integrase [Dermatophilaceae bacterium]